jgi:hypothetical protein
VGCLIKMNDDEVRRKLYDDCYKDCVSTIRSSTEAYDRNLIAISSAFILVPASLVRQISGPQHRLVGPVNFYAALGCFVFTITCVIASYMLSVKALHCRINDAHDYYINQIESAFNRNTIWSRTLSVVNVISGLAFFCGIFLTALFIYRNLGRFN